MGAWSFGVGATSGANSKDGFGIGSTVEASARAKLGVRCCSWESKKSALREWWQLGNCQWQWNIRRRQKARQRNAMARFFCQNINIVFS